jgi:hypothetical protein
MPELEQKTWTKDTYYGRTMSEQDPTQYTFSNVGRSAWTGAASGGSIATIIHYDAGSPDTDLARRNTPCSCKFWLYLRQMWLMAIHRPLRRDGGKVSCTIFRHSSHPRLRSRADARCGRSRQS